MSHGRSRKVAVFFCCTALRLHCGPLWAVLETIAGMIEYWTSEGHAFPAEGVDFSSKLDTDLYALAKAKTEVHSLEVSRDGTQFATFSSDRYGWDSSGLHSVLSALM